MTPPKLNKHEQRTKETRELLLQAAETVFVRDGYEKADLAEIAKLAGRTKGAIYAQFKSKEDIFLALVETNALRRRAMMSELLAQSTSVEGNLAALRQLLVKLAGDDVFGLLLLEYRLYTIRHPEQRERLMNLYKTLVPEDEDAAYTELLGASGKGKDALRRATAVHASFAMLYALQVEMRFEPSLFNAAMAKNIAGRIFDAMFDPPVKG